MLASCYIASVVPMFTTVWESTDKTEVDVVESLQSESAPGTM